MTLEEVYQEALVAQDYLRERGWNIKLQEALRPTGGEMVHLSVYLPQGPRGEQYDTFVTFVYSEYGPPEEKKWKGYYRTPASTAPGGRSKFALVEGETLFEAIENFNAEAEAGRTAAAVKGTSSRSEVIDRKLKARLLR